MEFMEKHVISDALGDKPIIKTPHKIIAGPRKIEYRFDNDSKCYCRIFSEEEKAQHYRGYKERIGQYIDYHGGLLDEITIVEEKEEV